MLHNVRDRVKWRLFVPAGGTLYRWVVNHFCWWPLAWMDRQKRWHPNAERRIVYYLWFFPTPSETFVQRELMALIDAGISVEIVAHTAEQEELFGAEPKALMKRTRYLRPISKLEVTRCAWRFFWRGPLRFINACLFVLFSRYDSRKSPALDLEVLGRYMVLAAVLREKYAQHVHAPWASVDAVVAMVAARLLRISYTVQARAYDIHRHSSAVGLSVKLANAAFVITNSRYNEAKLRSLLPSGNEAKIRAIYNGINLSRFQPSERVARGSHAVSILSVADFVEPKGLEYLMLACKILKERGYPITCQIVGGKVPTETNYYIKLQKLRRALAMDEIEFLGRQPFDFVLQKYGAADLFVLPAVTASHGGRDITPNVLIEAMAMKLPVVSTFSGAIPEIVDDGVCGLLVQPRNEQALAEAILRLIEDPPLARMLGSNARKKVEERFDIQKNIAQFVSLFTNGIEAPEVASLNNLKAVAEGLQH